MRKKRRFYLGYKIKERVLNYDQIGKILEDFTYLYLEVLILTII